MRIKLGSLFDGIGGFPLAGTYSGITPVWASEIEPAPVSITKRHFPGMQHLGDITKINGVEIEPTHIVTFGSPCTRLSVAGKHDGFDISFECRGHGGTKKDKPHFTHKIRATDKYKYLYEMDCPVCGQHLTETNESALFFHAVRVIAEMREKSNGKHPDFIVWENVPGAFSSNKGEDFKTVLEEICKIKDGNAVIPRPPKGKWSDAGCIMGDGYSIAWRVLAAQFWGVPQRRRRIYLVADFAGHRAGQILFEREGLPWNPAARGTPGKRVAADAQGGVRAASGFSYKASAGAGTIGFSEELAPSVLAQRQDVSVLLPTYCLQGNGIDRADTAGCNGKGWTENVCYTLNTVDRPAVYDMTHANDVIRECGELSPTLQARMGTGGNQVPLVQRNAPAIAIDCRNHCANVEISSTLQAKESGGQSLNYINPVCTFQNTGHGWWNESDVAQCLRTPCGGDSIKANLVARSVIAPTLDASYNDKYGCDQFVKQWGEFMSTNAVRRLTPLECDRLQGYPDEWTKYGHDGKQISDSARYKGDGNSLAIPCAEFVLSGIAEAIEQTTDIGNKHAQEGQMQYTEFLLKKQKFTPQDGFEAALANDYAFDWQKSTTQWALKTGCAALFEDCGLGKSLQELMWADEVAKHSGAPVFILAPLAVSTQTQREGRKFGFDVNIAEMDADIRPGINITNYEKLLKFDTRRFGGIVLDESSILKSYMGKTKQMLVSKFRDTPYKLAGTATPAPNDLMELLNHAEFLGIMRSSEALSVWFIADQKQSGKYRLKGHAEKDFWRWVASWAVCIEKPSDIGFSDEGYILPELRENDVIIPASEMAEDMQEGMFRKIDLSATGFYAEKRKTIKERTARCAEIARSTDEQCVIWCDTNEEADALKLRLPDAVEVRGSDKAEKKERAGIDFVNGKYQCLISKSSIFGFGLNFQNCRNTIFCGLDYSYESYYQAVRRFYRFGQARPVNVHRVIGSTEQYILDTINRKQQQKQDMARSMAAAMKEIQTGNVRGHSFTLRLEPQSISIPSWLRSESA